MNETIAAIATPHGVAGIGMVRVSGPDAVGVAARVVRPGGKRRVEELGGYMGLHGRAFDAQGDIDDVVLFIYRAPRSYTGEDVAEICCHGGMWLAQRVWEGCLAAGASPAGPGEFTKRAFLSGKMTLTQAEAVADLIAAEGAQTAACALAARDGAVYREITSIKDALVSSSASLAAWIDYPEEGQDAVCVDGLLDSVGAQARRIEGLLESAAKGDMLRGGVQTAIIGRPNVGKSTLMNLLSGSARSIVTDIPGTTRDVVEGRVQIGGVPLNLCDTAGIRKARDPVEEAGVALARARMDTAQLVLAVLDGSAPLEEEDIRLLRSLGGKPAIAVLNKMDLGAQLGQGSVKPYVGRVVGLSAKDGGGLPELENAIKDLLAINRLDPAAALLAGERQLGCAREAALSLADALDALRTGHTLDAVNVCLDCAIDALLSLTGERAGAAVVEEVFSKFCVGK